MCRTLEFRRLQHSTFALPFEQPTCHPPSLRPGSGSPVFTEFRPLLSSLTLCSGVADLKKACITATLLSHTNVQHCATPFLFIISGSALAVFSG
jgi:hypothetical protein